MNNKPPRNRARDIGFYALLIIILLATILTMNPSGTKSTDAEYSEVRDLFLQEKVDSFEAEGNVLTLHLKDDTVITCELSTISIFYDDLYDLVREQKDAGILSDYDFPPEWQAPWWVSFLPYLLVIGLFCVVWFIAMNKMQGGAAGGGYAQVVPMEDINLHFTGDFHAIGAANNLLAAMLDNHIQQGNALNIDPRRITWKRCMDMNDRQLRFIVDGLGGKVNGTPREDGFDITVASEIMAVLCLSTGIADLKERLGRMIVGYTYDDKPVTCAELKAAGAMTALLKDAIKPNLVQTLEGTPAFVHGGPFANIAHGCNSVMATRMALKMGDYAVTEAGFGADLGAEKFLDIKCRMANLTPDAVVIVATVRALKMHGGLAKTELTEENIPALERGVPNLLRHVSNIKNVFGLPCVVAVNRFPTDTDAEIDFIIEKCRELGVNTVLSTVWADGGRGGEALAREVVRLCDVGNGDFAFAYSADARLEDKIEAIIRRVYRGRGAAYLPAAQKQLARLADLGFGGLPVCIAPAAKKQIARLTELGFGNMPVCMAKTQYSFSDDQTKLGAPTGFTVTVRSVTVSAGAGFLVALTGDVLTMPGLPKVPAAENIDVDDDGRITGLF